MPQRVASIADASRHVGSGRRAPAELRRIDVLVRRLRREMVHVPDEQRDAVRGRVIAALRVVVDEHVASCVPPPRRSGAGLAATVTAILCAFAGLVLAPVLPAVGAALLVLALASVLAAVAVLLLRAGRRQLGRHRPEAPLAPER